MSKYATVTVDINGSDTLRFHVKTLSAGKRVKRLIEAMSLAGVGDVSVISRTTSYNEVSDILQTVFVKVNS